MLKIGILDSDHLSPAVIKRYGCYSDQFIKFLSPLQQQHQLEMTFNHYNVFEKKYPSAIHDNDVYLFTGSQYSSYDNLDWIHKLQEYVQELHTNKIKIIGICFGHQIIAQSLGGKVAKNKRGWEIGVTATHVVNRMDWMKPVREFFFNLVSHQDEVIQLPEDAINFVSTNLCEYSGFTIGNHILTFQGHPEFNKQYLKLIIRLQSNHLSTEQRKNARQSLKQSLDTELMRRWIANFIAN